MKIGIPKGRLGAAMAARAGFPPPEVFRRLCWVEGDKTYFLLRPSQIPHLVCHGLLDEGFCGSDTLDEFPMANLLEVLDSMPQPGVRMVLAGDDPWVRTTVRGRPLVVGTSYPNTASRALFGFPHILVEQPGCIEGLCPMLVDVIVDIVESGRTLEANGLTVIQELGELQLVRIRRKDPLAVR